MNKLQAKNLIENTFNNRFDKGQFRNFIINLLDKINETKAFSVGQAQVKEAFRKYVLSYQRIGQYTDKKGNIIDALIVHLNDKCSLDRSRTFLRNFVADYMRTKGKENALVAFYRDNSADWRFSFVKLEISLKQDDKGNVKVANEYTPAKRYSYLVGELEPNHTAQSRLVELLVKEYPTLEEIEEAFNVEKVSKEFFAQYKELFLQLVDNLKDIRSKDDRINFEFTTRCITEANFCKKLLGQLVFLYFIQKKGWLGVPKGANWGEGDKQFLRHTFEKALTEGKNFFNDYLEPLFYNALANGERDEQIFDLLECKIPFLNGGLFEPLNGYDWVNTDIQFKNDIFSNTEKNKIGDTGTGILDVFDRYNFTVKEDEPLEKEVAVDPEMLGKVFEELLEVQDRKSKGAFYTPREIVHYMCQESLINYLATELNASEDVDFDGLTKQDLADFIHHSDQISDREAIASQKEKSTSVYKHIISENIRKNAEAIDKALANIKICDPAIGSGAFPVGMLNEIVRARISLVESGFLKETKKHSVYEYKRQAIQNSIYGVDIESGAVEIAKLRLWLFLVVDEENIENIKALPNLDYKIVCGNSLFNVEHNLFNTTLFRQLEELKPQFFNETRKKEKKRLKKEIDAIIKELTKDGTFDFEIYFSEIFHEKNGFDVVIANPPYVGHKGGQKELFSKIKKYNLGIFNNERMDLFYYFFHLALNIMHIKGIATFITTNYYITADSAIKLRKDLKDRSNIIKLINFNELRIFESALGQHNLITFFEKNKLDEKQCFIINTNKKGVATSSVLNHILCDKDVDTNYFLKKQTALFDSKNLYIRLNPDNSNISTILDKIKKYSSSTLINYCNITQGLVSGCDKITKKHMLKFPNEGFVKDSGVFVIDKTYAQFANLETDILKPWFKNSDIYKYGANEHTTKFLIHLNTDVNISQYPNILSHINKYIKVITARNYDSGELNKAKKLKKLWVLSSSRKDFNFSLPKIISPQRTYKNIFGYTEKLWSASADVYFITSKSKDIELKYILSLLNSNLYYYWLYEKGKRKGEMLELYLTPLSEIPIKKVNEDIQSKFVSVVDKILSITQTDDYLENQEKQNAVKEYEKQIDIMVYKLYDLTYEEILTIDKEFSMSEQEYNTYKL